MKLFITAIALIIGSFNFYAYCQQDAITEIKRNMASGDAQGLAAYFNTTIDLMLPDIDKTYSKNHATQVLKDFFSKNKPKTFVINHKGTSNDGSIYLIGTYHAYSSNFRVYMLLKKAGNQFRIYQLHFE